MAEKIVDDRVPALSLDGNVELREKLRAIIKAPMRSEISTSDIAVGMWSSTALSEKIYDLEQLIQSECTQAADKTIEYVKAYVEDNTEEVRLGNNLAWTPIINAEDMMSVLEERKAAPSNPEQPKEDSHE